MRELLPDQFDLHWAQVDDLRWNAISSDLRASLTCDELSRARRFEFERDARRYILRRALLRRLIAQYTGIPPNSVRLSYSQQGKPYLAREHDLQFNLSHSGEFVLFGFCREAIGVDIESTCGVRNVSEAGHLFISEAELGRMTGLSHVDRERACLQVWARKEALLKAIGMGLIDGMQNIDLGRPALPGAATTVSFPLNKDWTIRDIVPHPDVVGAIAIPGTAGRWECRQFNVEP